MRWGWRRKRGAWENKKGWDTVTVYNVERHMYSIHLHVNTIHPLPADPPDTIWRAAFLSREACWGGAWMAGTGEEVVMVTTYEQKLWVSIHWNCPWDRAVEATQQKRTKLLNTTIAKKLDKINVFPTKHNSTTRSQVNVACTFYRESVLDTIPLRGHWWRSCLSETEKAADKGRRKRSNQSRFDHERGVADKNHTRGEDNLRFRAHVQ